MADNVCKCWENPLLTFAGPKQSLCCSGLVCEGTDGQLFTVCGSFPSALCNLPVNHTRGLQTSQQAPTGELMMLSPLWSHSSHSKLLTIYLDVIIVCDIIKEENLRLRHLIISLEKLARGSGEMGIGGGGQAISLLFLFFFLNNLHAAWLLVLYRLA